MSSEKKLITLTSFDGESFEVEEAVAKQSEFLKNMLEDVGADNAILVPEVTGFILGKVLDYCRKHADDAKDKTADNVFGADEPHKAWDKEFVKVEKSVLFDIMLAANYLNIKGLLELTFQTAADKIKVMTPEEVREYFDVENDFTKEEEEEVRRENQWAFEGEPKAIN